MPGEKIPLAVSAPATRLYISRRATRRAYRQRSQPLDMGGAGKSGVYEIKVKHPGGHTLANFSAFVMVPAARIDKGVLNNYQIGFYPETPLKGNPIYVPPKGFIEVTRDNEDTKVSENFRIKQFLTKQKSGYPKYVCDSTSGWCMHWRRSAGISKRAAGMPTTSSS